MSCGAERFSARETQQGEDPGMTAGILKKQSQFVASLNQLKRVKRKGLCREIAASGVKKQSQFAGPCPETRNLS
jgi:hypothetical protein